MTRVCQVNSCQHTLYGNHPSKFSDCEVDKASQDDSNQQQGIIPRNIHVTMSNLVV